MVNDGKRPQPTLEGTAKTVNVSAPARELPPPQKVKPPKVRTGWVGRAFSHLFAALLGGGIVAGAVWAIANGQIEGISLTDAETVRELRLLQSKTADLDRSVRGAARPATPAPSLSSAGEGTASPASNEVRARLDSVVSSLRGLESSVQDLTPRIAAVEQRAGNDQAFANLQAEVSRQTGTLQTRLAGLDRDVETLNKAQTERVADARSAALTLALTNLKRAISDGRGFGMELSAVETLSSTKLPVSQLASYKDGIPTLAELQRTFDETSKKAIEAHYRDSSGSMMGEVFARARAAIQVKPAGGTGTSIEAVIGRMSAALKAGNVAEAVSAGVALDGEAKDVMKPWMERAQSRVASEDVLRKTDQDLLAALTKPVTRRQ